MRNRPKTVVALATAVSLIAGQASAMCVNNSERQAMSMRVLQTELMVAALTCGQQGEYNTFVRKFEGELVDRGKALRAAFQRMYGGQGQPRLDGFITRLANEASQRSIASRADFCPRAAELYNVVLNTPPAGLAAVADGQPFSDAHGASECTTEVARDIASEPAPAAKAKAKPR